ncbi:MAG: HAD hydrolase-like protein [Planctomycetota bacterium]
MLVLFDIDMTLVRTDGAGIEALEAAGTELFGAHVSRELAGRFRADSIAYGGRIDPVIFAELLSVNGIEPTAGRVAALRDGYSERLPALLPGRARALPGAIDVVSAVSASEATAGVLTGNIERTGSAKLAAAGFDLGQFEVCVWGDDSPHDVPTRDHLPPIALDRDAAMRGERLDARRAVVVGDTVHDVACARAHGLRCLGVATGKHAADVLADAGADRVVADLTDTEGIVSWLVN